jgi:hypothetical protein
VVVFGQLYENRDKDLIFYEAVQGAPPVDFDVKKYDPPREDSDFCLRAAKLRSALADFEGEQRPSNTYVLLQDRGQMYGYILPASTETGVYPLVGDVRYLISSDGNTFIKKHPMHKSILEFDPLAASEKLVMGVHLRAPTCSYRYAGGQRCFLCPIEEAFGARGCGHRKARHVPCVDGWHY